MTTRTPGPHTQTTALSARSITVVLNDVVIVDQIDLEARSSEMVGVIGPSGCGKTTLLRALAGLIPVTSGEVRYGGRPTPRPREIAMLAQHPRLVTNPRWTLRRIVTEPADILGINCDIGEVADRVGLDARLLDRYPGQVSDGQLQRACLGRLLVQRPTTVLCDEPTSMLDPVAARAVVGLLAELTAAGAAVVMVSHQLELVRSRCALTIQLGN